MADISHYEELLALWREKEELAETMRKFRDNGGVHHLTIAVIRAEPGHAAAATPILNAMMKKGTGWQKILDAAVMTAERDARQARIDFEGMAYASEFIRRDAK